MGLLDLYHDRISQDYLKFLDRHPAGASVGEWVVLYGRDSIDERNQTYQVQLNVPQSVAIGDDSGGRAILLRLDYSDGVYICGHGALGSVELEPLSPSFKTWFDEGCPLPEEEERKLPLCGDLWLIGVPAGGLKDLLRLKNLLGLQNNLGELKQKLTQTPCLLAESIPPVAFSKRLANEPELASVIGFSDRGSSEICYHVMT